MEAFQVIWTGPFRHQNPGKEYQMADFEILALILSALKWRQKNGKVRLFTDQMGYRDLQRNGLEELWDGGIQVSLDEWIPPEVNPSVFWAAGKLYALKEIKEPLAMVDIDFIVWETLNLAASDEVVVIHREELTMGVYPPKEYFKVNENYHFDEEFDWTELPCNTAFLYIKDIDFKNYYVDQAIHFMENSPLSDNPVTYITFAEQRLLPMCAKKMGKEITSLSTLDDLMLGKDQRFTHLWSYKKTLQNDYNERKKFCSICIQKIIEEFPNMKDTLEKMESLQPYFEKEN